MPTCIEKSCRKRCKQNCTPRQEKCCTKIVPYCTVEENECCALDNYNVKTNNSKPLNVRLKLQLVNDDKNKNSGCLCAKYFEMLDACYGGMCPYGNLPKRGMCPQQAPYNYDNQPVTPFFIDYPPTIPELPMNLQTFNQTNNMNTPCTYTRKYKEMNTQTNDNDQNKGCLHLCEDYIEKLLENKEERFTPTTDQNIQTLTHIHSALAGITKTLQEIQNSLKLQQNNDNKDDTCCEIQNKKGCCTCETHRQANTSASYNKPEIDSTDYSYDDLDSTIMHTAQPQINFPGFWPILPKSMPPPPPPLLPSFRIPSTDDLSWLKSLPDSIFNKDKFLNATKPPFVSSKITLPSRIPRTVQSQPPSSLPTISEKSSLLSNFENKSAKNVLESISLGEEFRVKSQNSRRVNQENFKSNHKNNLNAEKILGKRRLQEHDNSTNRSNNMKKFQSAYKEMENNSFRHLQNMKK